MNLPLLCVVLPLAALYFISYAMFAWRMQTMSAQKFATLWGGLTQKPRIFLWCLTFVVSSIGGILTFYVYVQFTNDDTVFPVVLFGVLDISFIIFIYAVEGDRVNLVRGVLWLNVVAYIILFAYSLVIFPVDNHVVGNPALLYVTHVFNAVAIFHVSVMDLVIWWGGWVEHYEHELLK
jgi:hypothetical protein